MIRSILVILTLSVLVLCAVFGLLVRKGFWVFKAVVATIALCGLVLVFLKPVVGLLPMGSVSVGLCDRIEVTPQQLVELKSFVNSEEAINAASQGIQLPFSASEFGDLQSCYAIDLSSDDPSQTDVYFRLDASGLTRSGISKLLKYAEQMKPIVHQKAAEIQR